MIGVVLNALGLASLPDDKAERDARKAADLKAAEATEGAELDRLERLQVAARQARHERDAAIEAEHAAHELRLADDFARATFPELAAGVRDFADEPSRRRLPVLIKTIQTAHARGVAQLGDQSHVGGPIPATWPALALIERMLPSRPDLLCAAPRLGDAIGSASGAVLRAALSGNVPALETALYALEEQVESLAARHPRYEPTVEHREAWKVLTTSGRVADREARLAVVGERHGAAVAAAARAEHEERTVRETPALATIEASDEPLEQYEADTRHFERLAAEMSAPRAVQTRT